MPLAPLPLWGMMKIMVKKPRDEDTYRSAGLPTESKTELNVVPSSPSAMDKYATDSRALVLRGGDDEHPTVVGYGRFVWVREEEK